MWDEKKLEVEFYRGVICCLAVIVVYDQQTLFDEIIRTVDEVELVRVARMDGAMRWSGLTKYGYGKRK